MMDWFKAALLRDEYRDHVLTDDAVLYAVNLGAVVHNLLGAYEQGMESQDWTRYRKKLYELSSDFHTDESKALRENMRKEWVRRCTQRGL